MNVRGSAALLALPLLLTLTGCVGGSAEDAETPGAKTLAYRGFEVACYSSGYGEYREGTCDFGAFYDAHPAVLSDDSLEAEDSVKWIEVEGKPLACVSVGYGKGSYMGCDWIRYDHAYRPAKPR